VHDGAGRRLGAVISGLFSAVSCFVLLDGKNTKQKKEEKEGRRNTSQICLDKMSILPSSLKLKQLEVIRAVCLNFC